MSGKTCFSITTYCLRLCCRHPEWLSKTQELYNQVEQFYYNMLLKYPQLRGLDSQQTLRELEILSLPGRNGRKPEMPLPWEKVPVYFRRSAANAGIAAAKSYFSRNDEKSEKAAVELNSTVNYYKGMYRDFSSSEITLKVFDGSKWKWMRCRLYGRSLPTEGRILSPSVVIERKFVMLHVPVKEYGGDGRTIGQRISENQNICAIQFANSDIFAVGSVLDTNGRELAVKFWGGGREYIHQCNELQKRIEKSKISCGPDKIELAGRKYRIKQEHVLDTKAHQISADIVRFCIDHDVSTIVFPKYNDDHLLKETNISAGWNSLHLNGRIRRFVTYKAWSEGIATLDVKTKAFRSVCSKCEGKVVSIDGKTNEFKCENGHQGNSDLNAARNLGKKCLSKFGVQIG